MSKKSTDTVKPYTDWLFDRDCQYLDGKCDCPRGVCKKYDKDKKDAREVRDK